MTCDIHPARWLAVRPLAAVRRCAARPVCPRCRRPL